MFLCTLQIQSEGLMNLVYRSERKGVPNILTAVLPLQKRQLPGRDDFEDGYYEDGAYVAAPTALIPEMSDDGEDEESEVDPQQAYYTALLERFTNFRTSLTTSLLQPPQINAALNYATALNAAPHRWEHAFCTRSPTPLHIAALTQEDIIRGLDRIGELTSKKVLLDVTAGHNVSTWMWGLMGKCRDLGEMTSEEVGTLRELGKRSLSLGRKLASGRLTVVDEPRATVDTPTMSPSKQISDGNAIVPRQAEDNG